MRELLVDLVPWGAGVIVALQAAFGNTLDPLLRAITRLGDVYVCLALLPLALWRGDKPRGMRLALLLLFSVYLNLVLKAVFAIPRPFVVSPAVQAKDVATGYAFPSGHAQGVTTLWAGLAVIYGGRWVLAAGALLIPLVSFSRVYLGVHYPQDAIGGFLLGLVVVGAYGLLEPPFSRWWRRQPMVVWIVVSVLVPLAMAGLTPDPDARAVAGVILGLAVGRAIEVGWEGIGPAPGTAALALRMFVGAATTGLAYIVPSLAVDALWAEGVAPPVFVTVGRYAVVGLAVSLGAPWLFLRLGLSADAHAPEEREP